MPGIVIPSRASLRRNFLAICARVGIRSVMSCTAREKRDREREEESTRKGETQGGKERRYNKTRGEISPRTWQRAGREAEAF